MYGVGQGFVSEGELAYNQYRLSPSKTIKRIVSWAHSPGRQVLLTYSTYGSCGWLQVPLELFLNDAFRHCLGHV